MRDHHQDQAADQRGAFKEKEEGITRSNLHSNHFLGWVLYTPIHPYPPLVVLWSFSLPFFLFLLIQGTFCFKKTLRRPPRFF